MNDHSSLLVQIAYSTCNMPCVEWLKLLVVYTTQKTHGLSCTEVYSKDCNVEITHFLTQQKHMHVWKSLSSDKLPVRHRKCFWETFQERLNELLLMLNVGDRSSNVISLDDDKKNGDFSNKDRMRCYEGLKFGIHPNLRKGMIGHAAASPFTNLTCDVSWAKIGHTSTHCHIEITNMLFEKR